MFNRLRIRKRFAPSVIRAGRGLLIAIGISLVLLALAYYKFADGFTDKSPWSPERWRAFLDAILAGIAGFTIVGTFTFFFSLKPPEEDGIEERIEYLYSARHKDANSCRDYVRSQVQLLSAMITSCKAHYRALEASADGKFVRYSISSEMILCNMMKYDRYQQVMPLRVRTDGLEGFVQNIGTVNRVVTTAITQDGNHDLPINWIEHPAQITQDAREFRVDISLDIPPGGKLKYEYSYEAWQKADDEFWFGSNRFVEIAELFFMNMTNHNFELRPNPDTKVPGVRTLKETSIIPAGQNAMIGRFHALPPTEDVTFFITKG